MDENFEPHDYSHLEMDRTEEDRRYVGWIGVEQGEEKNLKNGKR